MKIRFLSIPLCVLISACAPQAPVEEQAPAVEQPAAPIVEATPLPTPQIIQPQGKWLDWPISKGDWVYRQDARGSLALFGEMGADALVTLRCDTQRRRIYLARKSLQQSGKMTIRTNTNLKEFSANTTGGTPSYIAIEMSVNDPILDAISYSRGRFAIESTDNLSVAIPVWSEISRVIDDCR